MKLKKYVVLWVMTFTLVGIFTIGLGVSENIERTTSDKVSFLEVADSDGYNLTIRDPVGEGTIEVDGIEITEWPYEEEYEEGTEVDLTARPYEGWEFKHWGGPGAIGFGQKRRDNNITLEINEDKELYVYFFKVEYVEIEPEEDLTVAAGEKINFTAHAFGWAYEQSNYRIDDEYVEFEWENTDAYGLFEEKEIGEYNVTATYVIEDYENVTSPVTTVTVEPAGVDYIEIDPIGDQTITAGDTIDFSASAYDEYDNLIEDDDGEFTWQNTDGTGFFDETTAGVYEVTAGYEDVTSPTVTVTVDVAELDYVEIDPIGDQTITAGETIDFSAGAYDQYGNLIEEDDSEFVWQNTDDTGFFEETEAREYDVTATYEGTTSESTTVVVEPAGVDYVEIDPAGDQTVQAGDTIDFSASAYDEYDNLITEDIEDFEWENAPNGEFYETVTGDYEVIAIYEDVSSRSISVTVEPGDVETVEIVPKENQTITAGEKIEFLAWANDTYGNVITDSPEDFEWENAPNGIFEKFGAGEYEIRAEYEGVSSDPVNVESISNVKPVMVILSVILTLVIGFAIYKKIGGGK